MRLSHITFGVINLFLLTHINLAVANSSLDLLELPAKQSSLASKSVLMAITPVKGAVLAVGAYKPLTLPTKRQWKWSEIRVSGQNAY